jgi:hypothetical protein
MTHLDRPLGLQEVEAPRISIQSAQEGGKVVSPKHQPSLPAGKIPGTHLQAESTTRAIMGLEGQSEKLLELLHGRFAHAISPSKLSILLNNVYTNKCIVIY